MHLTTKDEPSRRIPIGPRTVATADPAIASGSVNWTSGG